MQYFYIVQPGDTLAAISERWRVSLTSLVAANHLNSPNLIFVGQQLSIPPGVFRYRVKSGDTVYSLSQYFRVHPSIIIQNNQLKPPYTIYVDQLLFIPPGMPYYIVQPGDTLHDLAIRYHVITNGNRNIELLQHVNQLPSPYIFPGMWLQIPYSPPGGNDKIAFTASQNGNYDIWLYHSKDGTIIQLTNGIADVFSVPVFSPDGKSIAFVGRERLLYVIDLENDRLSTIDQFHMNDDLHIAWSPNSSTLSYTTRNQIIFYQLTSHAAQSIKQTGATNVQWFPNGSEIVYQAPDENGISQVYRILVNGTERRLITNNTNGPLHAIQLSPDGDFLLYTTPGASISLIHTIELSTGTIFALEGGPLAKNYYPRWNPHSQTIAFSATAYEELGYFNQIRTAEKNGEQETIHALSNCFASPVTWSVDGDKIVYLSGCQGQEFASEIWMIDLNDPVPIKLLESDLTIISLNWKP
ncbi:LysM peptidoglycan-binding domain-containing protein [Oceanobacillus halophilus]|uniref:LysM peptidoglycan-binding domain-containing protein n=1 Tax=Oceanobacillus halophilus TaxID=930130 RepID=A0A495A2K7_9BACI|nr:LysM peptidoglycan-binding domain-containing protein [Oceanobacillus halophilus]RKQ33517.1 LysM peptidoglycan-binding domain-containing protein [Oceanobacillus halophilus]